MGGLLLVARLAFRVRALLLLLLLLLMLLLLLLLVLDVFGKGT